MNYHVTYGNHTHLINWSCWKPAAGGGVMVLAFFVWFVCVVCCSVFVSGGWSIFGGWSQIFVPQAQLLHILAQVHQLMLTAMQICGKNCTKSLWCLHFMRCTAIGLTFEIGATGEQWAKGTMMVMVMFYVFFVGSCVFFDVWWWWLVVRVHLWSQAFKNKPYICRV
jgi:hypothetical protein